MSREQSPTPRPVSPVGEPANSQVGARPCQVTPLGPCPQEQPDGLHVLSKESGRLRGAGRQDAVRTSQSWQPRSCGGGAVSAHNTRFSGKSDFEARVLAVAVDQGCFCVTRSFPCCLPCSPDTGARGGRPHLRLAPRCR